MLPRLLRRVFTLQLLEEASPIAGVAYWTGRLSLYQNGIAIAILADGLQPQEIARGFALVPQFLPAAAVEPDVSADQCALERLLVHIAQHQDFTIPGILDNSWNQAFVIKL